jgi:hypothetical protein
MDALEGTIVPVKDGRFVGIIVELADIVVLGSVGIPVFVF